MTLKPALMALHAATTNLIAIAQVLVSHPWTEKQRTLVLKIERASQTLQTKLTAEPDPDLHRYRHDLRTPLTVILGYCEVLMNQPNLRELPALVEVYRQGQDILGLIAELKES